MKTMMKTTLLATSLVLALTACGSKKDKKQPDPGKDSQVTVSQDGPGSKPEVTVDSKPVTTAAGLADAGEQLVGPDTFMLADKVFDSALQIDPNNKKAQFYKAFLKRMMTFKGVMARIRPLVKTYGGTASHEEYLKIIPSSNLKNFLLEGQEDILTTSQAQDLVNAYIRALSEFRKFLKMNPDLELTLNMNTQVFAKALENRASKNCVIIPDSNNGYRATCDFSNLAQRKVNSADLVVLAQATAGEMMFWTVMNSYDLTTIHDLNQDNAFKSKTDQEKLDALKALPSVAKLRKDQNLNLIISLGPDLSAATKWAIQYQKQLCVTGDKDEFNREGFLVEKGVCIENMPLAQKRVAQLDLMLQSAIPLDVKKSKNEEIEIKVDLLGFLKAPPRELKQVLPESISEEGITQFGADKTLGGLLPDADADRLTVK